MIRFGSLSENQQWPRSWRRGGRCEAVQRGIPVTGSATIELPTRRNFRRSDAFFFQCRMVSPERNDVTFEN
jgi:hypothetical protein